MVHSESIVRSSHVPRLVTLLIAVALVGAACGSSATSAPAASSAAAPAASTGSLSASTPPSGGSMSWRLGADVTTWDPCQLASTTPGTQVDPLAAVYGLLVYTDVHGVVQPGMAQSLTTTDGMTWTLKLRPGVKFTDGAPYDAAAVKYNWDRIANPANACQSQKWVSTFTTTVVDPQTLSIKLASVDNNFALKVAELHPAHRVSSRAQGSGDSD